MLGEVKYRGIAGASEAIYIVESLVILAFLDCCLPRSHVVRARNDEKIMRSDNLVSLRGGSRSNQTAQNPHDSSFTYV